MTTIKKTGAFLCFAVAAGILFAFTSSNLNSSKAEDPAMLEKRMNNLLDKMFTHNEDVSTFPAILQEYYDLNEAEYVLYNELRFGYTSELARKRGVSEETIAETITEARWVNHLWDSLSNNMYNVMPNKLDETQRQAVNKVFKSFAKKELALTGKMEEDCAYVNYPGVTSPGNNAFNTWFYWSRRTNEPGGETFCDFEYQYYGYNNRIQAYSPASWITVNHGFVLYVHWGNPNWRTSVLCGYSDVALGVVFAGNLDARMQLN